MDNYLFTANEVHHYGNKLFSLIADGALRPTVHKEYPFTTEGVQAAQTDLTTGKTTGKLLIKVADD